MRDSNNRLNGILLENAGIAIVDQALDPNAFPQLRDLANQDLQQVALATLASNGITSTVDARCFWGRDQHLPYQKALQDNRLTAKIVLSMWAYPQMDDVAQIAKLKSLFTNDKTSRLRQSQIKLYMDGLLDTRTAAVLQPYLTNDPDFGIGKNGLNYFTQDRLKSYLGQLQDLGYSFLIHTIGDAAARQALNAIEQTPPSSQPRHKLTHMEVVDPADMGRFAALGVIADPQVAGNFALPTDTSRPDLVSLLGPDRANPYIPVKALKDAGATVTLSSDFDVSKVNPFRGMAHAINRGDQSIDLKSAVEMYTINGAFSMRQEDRTGSLEVGKDADFIVVDQDIFALAAQGNAAWIEGTKVLSTVLEGEEIYRNGM